MINPSLADDYIYRAKIRINILKEFLRVHDYSDTIREAQEVVELIQKAMLLRLGIDPPKWHDVIDIILENKEKLPTDLSQKLSSLRKDAKWLRTQREISFYSKEDADRAITTAQEFFSLLEGFP
jgi:HEPN domain-containing protein